MILPVNGINVETKRSKDDNSFSTFSTCKACNLKQQVVRLQVGQISGSRTVRTPQNSDYLGMKRRIIVVNKPSDRKVAFIYIRGRE